MMIGPKKTKPILNFKFFKDGKEKNSKNNRNRPAKME